MHQSFVLPRHAARKRIKPAPELHIAEEIPPGGGRFQIRHAVRNIRYRRSMTLQKPKPQIFHHHPGFFAMLFGETPSFLAAWRNFSASAAVCVVQRMCGGSRTRSASAVTYPGHCESAGPVPGKCSTHECRQECSECWMRVFDFSSPRSVYEQLFQIHTPPLPTDQRQSLRNSSSVRASSMRRSPCTWQADFDLNTPIVRPPVCETSSVAGSFSGYRVSQNQSRPFWSWA